MLLIFGELYVELRVTQDSLMQPVFGGALLRQAEAGGESGARLRLLGRVGRDDYGRAIRSRVTGAEIEGMLQEDDDRPTSLLLWGEEGIAYRMADARLQPPGDAFFDGGTLLHAGSWIFGQDPGRTTAVEVFREGLRRGLALSLDLRVARWACRGDLEEVLRPYLPLGFMKIDADAAVALDIKPGELFQWAGQVLYFDGGTVRRLSLFEEKSYTLPAKASADAIYGRFLAGVASGADADEALRRALGSADEREEPEDGS